MNCFISPLVIIAALLSYTGHGATNDTIPEQKNLSVIHFINGGKQRELYFPHTSSFPPATSEIPNLQNSMEIIFISAIHSLFP